MQATSTVPAGAGWPWRVTEPEMKSGKKGCGGRSLWAGAAPNGDQRSQAQSRHNDQRENKPPHHTPPLASFYIICLLRRAEDNAEFASFSTQRARGRPHSVSPMKIGVHVASALRLSQWLAAGWSQRAVPEGGGRVGSGVRRNDGGVGRNDGWGGAGWDVL